MFKGSMVALVTPFKDGALDEQAVRKLVDFQIAGGTSALVPCGTTGESATLSHQEHDTMVETVIDAAKKRIPVIAGSGSNNTAEAVRLTKHAKEAGADAALLISPYYNKPTQKGIYLHYKAIAEAVDIPLIIYNIASRTGINIEPDTFAALSKVKNIVGVKEASGNIDQMTWIVKKSVQRFFLISGDDALTLPVLSIGGTGVISVVANIVPKDVAAMVEHFSAGRIEEARALHYKLCGLVKSMFIETNPIPVKTAMGMMKMIDPELRLPLCSMEEENVKKLKTALEEYGLLK
ncbi:MAG: 4-hydroxy-tetrahydrodipicolinate synthase [Candidatus Omnitrophota bacterium]